jgi:endoglucanase
MITLEFWSIDTAGLAVINNGSKDAYLRAFADAAKASGTTIWLRPFHEMNGNWYPWCGTVGTNSPAQLVAAWKRVHDIFVARGATNVKFVWSINDNSCPNTAANLIESYYPGDAYVDYTAIDQYNSGTSQTWSHWTPFASAFADPYKRLTTLTTKPLLISEIGCAEVGGNKALWIADMFQQIRTTYTKVIGVCWFNMNKETDWRVDSSAASLTSFKTELAKGF